MAIPTPAALKAKNAGKQLAADSICRNEEPRAVKVAKQIEELHEMIARELTENYNGEPLLVPVHFAFKESLDTIVEEFNETGLWSVRKTWIPIEPEEINPYNGKPKTITYLSFEESNGQTDSGAFS